jgi:hypothetical protein
LARAKFIVGFLGRIPDGLTEGATFLNGTVVGVDPALAFAVVQTTDAASFEDQAAEHPRVRYVELNVSGDKPPWDWRDPESFERRKPNIRFTMMRQIGALPASEQTNK